MQYQYLLSRKFLLCLATLLITSLLVYIGSINEVVYGSIITVTVGAYIAGNVLQKTGLQVSTTPATTKKEGTP